MPLSSLDPFTWVLVGLVAYMLLAMSLRTRGLLPDSVKVSGPITTIHTKRGRAFLEWLSGPKRFWNAWGNLGLAIAVLVGIITVPFILSLPLQLLSQSNVPVNYRPQDVLVIPGVNKFLPWSAAPEILAGLLIGMVVHEGGHGLYCRVEGMDIDSMGVVLFTLLPIGAFVEPDEEDVEAADGGSQGRMFSAGVMNNFAIGVVAYLLFLGPIAGAIAPVAGVAVGGTVPGGPADAAGVERGDVITGVNGSTVEDDADLREALNATESQRIQVDRADRPSTVVERSLVVMQAIQGGPFEAAANQTVTEVNGTAVHTEGDFDRAVRNGTVATVTFADGSTTTAPMGAYASAVAEDGPLAAAGAPAGEPVVVTRIDGERVAAASDLTSALDETSPGQEVSVEVYHDGAADTYQVQLGRLNEGDETGYLGVTNVRTGTSGVVLTDFGITSYPASQYLGALQTDGSLLDAILSGSILQQAASAMFLPTATISGVAGAQNFPGFVGAIANFYTIPGLSPTAAGLVFGFGNVLFWTAWINFQIGFFNCIPLYPLDGGRILKTGVEGLSARLPIENVARFSRSVVVAVTITMLVSVLSLVFAPIIAG